MTKTRTMNRPIRMFFMAASSRSIRKHISPVKRALPLMEAHARIRRSMFAERCESGRIDMLGKHASRQRDRGFESHPLRHTIAVGIGNRSPNGNYVAIQVTKKGWDSNRGCEGEIPLHGERTRGLGPLSRSASRRGERDFE